VLLDTDAIDLTITAQSATRFVPSIGVLAGVVNGRGMGGRYFAVAIYQRIDQRHQHENERGGYHHRGDWAPNHHDILDVDRVPGWATHSDQVFPVPG
jgi:hypothetical protein